MERIPLIFPVTLLPEEIKKLDEIKNALADTAKKLGTLTGTSRHVDLTLVLGAAFNIKEVLRLQSVVDCTNHSYELRMAIIKIETAYNKYQTRVTKPFVPHVINLMNYVTIIETMLLRSYKQYSYKPDPDQEELPFP